METRQDKGKLRQERILEAAQEVFANKGYNEAAMDDIASESQTSKGGLYFHFPNKQAIFLALLNQMAALLLSRVRAAMVNEPQLAAKGDAALKTVLYTFAGHPRLTRLFLIEAPGAGHEFNAKLMEMHVSFVAIIKDYLDEAQKQGLIDANLDTEIAGIAWFGAINEVVLRWLMGNRSGVAAKPLEVAYPTLREILRRGLGMQIFDFL